MSLLPWTNGLIRWPNETINGMIGMPIKFNTITFQHETILSHLDHPNHILSHWALIEIDQNAIYSIELIQILRAWSIIGSIKSRTFTFASALMLLNVWEPLELPWLDLVGFSWISSFRRLILARRAFHAQSRFRRGMVLLHWSLSFDQHLIDDCKGFLVCHESRLPSFHLFHSKSQSHTMPARNFSFHSINWTSGMWKTCSTNFCSTTC